MVDAAAVILMLGVVDFSWVPDLFLVWLPFAVMLGLMGGALWLFDLLLLRRQKLSADKRLPRQITMAVLTLLAVIMAVLALPGTELGVSESTRGNLLSLIGLSVTALITLSSTTLAANAMAGLMLRATAPFRGGDWIRVGEHFGRVTERGLFHTEVQTEDKDLLSLPNLLLATNPVRILHERGTIISTELSLGYDTPHHAVEPLLLEAATLTGLVNPFVWIMELKDHAVVYRVAGLLEDVTGLISVRSRLRSNVLTTLHKAGIEIASPSLVIQRRGTMEDTTIPQGGETEPLPALAEGAGDVEKQLFDKADEAARRTSLEEERDLIDARLKALAEGEPSSDPLDAVQLKRRLEEIDTELSESPPQA
ncbi:MAG: mechanosensitive ion channel [Phycisphaeraceae bacterium]